MRNVVDGVKAEHWVDTWVSTPQRAGTDQLPPEPFTRDGYAFADTTVRQTLRVSLGGAHLRLRFSNLFGDRPLRLTRVWVALPADGRAGARAVTPDSARPVTFSGHPAVAVPAGGEVESDPLDFPLSPATNITVTLHIAEGLPASAVTSHPGSRTTSYLAVGDRVADDDVADATAIDHWYFLTGVRVTAPPDTPVAVMMGDSLTDGRGSTTNVNNRWPDLLFDRLQRDPRTAGVAVLNHGVGGSRLLDDGRGPGAVARHIDAALARTGLRWLVIFKGINDIGAADATEEAQRRVRSDLISAYEEIATQVRKHGARVYGATLLPFGGFVDYDDPAGHRRRTREEINHWIRTAGRFDAVIDFDRAVRNPSRPSRLIAELRDGDGIHLNPAGYRALAEAIPTTLFEPTG